MSLGTQLITARVHEGILEKADRPFRNDDAGVWIEPCRTPASQPRPVAARSV